MISFLWRLIFFPQRFGVIAIWCNYVFIVVSFRCINLRVNSVPQTFILFPCRWVLKRDSFFMEEITSIHWFDNTWNHPWVFRDLSRLSTNGACLLQCFKNSVFQLCQPLTTSVSDKIFSRHSLPAMSFKNSFRRNFYNVWTLGAYDLHCHSVIWLHQWLWRVSNVIVVMDTTGLDEKWTRLAWVKNK